KATSSTATGNRRRAANAAGPAARRTTPRASSGWRPGWGRWWAASAVPTTWKNPTTTATPRSCRDHRHRGAVSDGSDGSERGAPAGAKCTAQRYGPPPEASSTPGWIRRYRSHGTPQTVSRQYRKVTVRHSNEIIRPRPSSEPLCHNDKTLRSHRKYNTRWLAHRCHH